MLFSAGKTLNFTKFGTKWPNFYVKFGNLKMFAQVKLYSGKFLFAPQTVLVYYGLAWVKNIM